MIRAFSILMVLALSGCASTLRVTYYSDPPGAVLYSGGVRVGYTPQTLDYNVSDEDKKRGYSVLEGTRVQWVSGATAENKSIRANLANGLAQSLSYKRPNGVPGRESDEKFAIELQRAIAIQQQADSLEAQAAAQRYLTYQQAENIRLQNEQLKVPKMPYYQPVQQNQPYRCTSEMQGRELVTNCH